MEQFIELNDLFFMKVVITYEKESKYKPAYYEITTEIYNKEKYLEEKSSYRGEPLTRFKKTFTIYSFNNPKLMNYHQKQLKKRVKSAINAFHRESKKIVQEWNNRDEMFMDVKKFITKLNNHSGNSETFQK